MLESLHTRHSFMGFSLLSGLVVGEGWVISRQTDCTLTTWDPRARCVCACKCVYIVRTAPVGHSRSSATYRWEPEALLSIPWAPSHFNRSFRNYTLHRPLAISLLKNICSNIATHRMPTRERLWGGDRLPLNIGWSENTSNLLFSTL